MVRIPVGFLIGRRHRRRRRRRAGQPVAGEPSREARHTPSHRDRVDRRPSDVWHVTVRGLLAKRRRLVGTVVAIVIGVSFISGVYVLSDTIRRTFDDLFASVYRGTDVVVTPAGDSKAGSVRRHRACREPYSRRCDLCPESPARRARSAATHKWSTPRVFRSADRARRPSGASGSTTARVNPFSIETGHAPVADMRWSSIATRIPVGHFRLGDSVEVLVRHR